VTVQVAIYLYPGVEVLDFAGPYEVFTTASRVHLRRHPGGEPPFAVCTVAKTAAPVQARAGLRAVPDYTLADCPPIDVLIIPGGVVDDEVADADVVAWARERSVRASLTASVCTGAFILAEAGLLRGKTATTHWEDVADLRAKHPGLDVREGMRWVDQGSIVTSAGIAAGIDMSLHLVARLVGPELARLTARQMDVPYHPEP
jgi:transcriptional regulator GlxA family with amidase domain